MKKSGLLIVLGLLILSSILFNPGSSEEPPIGYDPGIDIPNQPASRTDTRALNINEKSVLGGSWLDTFDDAAGIDLAGTDMVNWTNGEVKLKYSGYNMVLNDSFSSPLNTNVWVNNTGGGTNFYSHPELKATKNKVAQTFPCYIETKKSWNYLRTVEWKWNSVSDSPWNGFAHHVAPFIGPTNNVIVDIRANREIYVLSNAIQIYKYPSTLNANQWYTMKIVIEDTSLYFEVLDQNDSPVIQQTLYPSSFPLNEYGIARISFASTSSNNQCIFETKADNFKIFEKKLSSLGNVTSKTIALPDGMQWDRLLIDKNEPANTYANITILNATSLTAVPGFESITSQGEIDISSINSKGITEIKLKGELKSDFAITPALKYWGVSWKPVDSWRDTFFAGNRVDGSDSVEVNDGFVTCNIPSKTRGYLNSSAIPIPGKHYYDTLIVNKSTPAGTSLEISLYDPISETPVPGFSNIASTSADLSSINPVTYPRLQLRAVFKAYTGGTPSLYDWAINWVENSAPTKNILNFDETQVLRTRYISYSIDVGDAETAEAELVAGIYYKAPGSANWKTDFLETPVYKNNNWMGNFSPPKTAVLGMYSFRVDCMDVFGGWYNVTYTDMVEVLNNVPGKPVLEISPALPKTTDDITVNVIDCYDVEDESITYTYEWYRNDILQAGETGTIISAAETKKGDIWKCVVIPNDGNFEGDGSSNSTTVEIINTAPVISKKLVELDIDEDGYDSTSVNLLSVFIDADDDDLSFEVSGDEHITVEIDQDTGAVSFTPDADWFGTEVLVFSANDSEKDTSEDLKVNVMPRNDPPRLIKAGNIEVKSADTILAFTVYQDRWLNVLLTAVDIDGDTLLFSTNRTDNVGVDDIDPELMMFEDNALMFKPDNSHVGTFLLNLSLSDLNGSVVYYDMEIEVLNTNDPPTVFISYPSNGTSFKEDDLIDFACTFYDPDLEIPKPVEELTVTWTTNRTTTALGSGIGLSNLTGVQLIPGYHKITVKVEDKDGASDKDVLYLFVEKKVEDKPASPVSEVSSNYWWIFLLLIIIIIFVAIIVIVLKRRKPAEKVEVEYMPKGEVAAAPAKAVVKPGTIAAPTIDMEQVGAPAAAAALPAGTTRAEPGAQAAAVAGVNVPEPVSSEPRLLPEARGAPAQPTTTRTEADILGIKMDADAYGKDEPVTEPHETVKEEEEPKKIDFTGADTSAYTLEGGPKAVKKEAVWHEAEYKVVETVDTDSSSANLRSAKEIKATEEVSVVHEGDKSVWRPDTRGKAAASKEILEQIEKLAEMKNKGILTEEEFQRKKQELLK